MSRVRLHKCKLGVTVAYYDGPNTQQTLRYIYASKVEGFGRSAEDKRPKSYNKESYEKNAKWFYIHKQYNYDSIGRLTAVLAKTR